MLLNPGRKSFVFVLVVVFIGALLISAGGSAAQTVPDDPVIVVPEMPSVPGFVVELDDSALEAPAAVTGSEAAPMQMSQDEIEAFSESNQMDRVAAPGDWFWRSGHIWGPESPGQTTYNADNVRYTIFNVQVGADRFGGTGVWEYFETDRGTCTILSDTEVECDLGSNIPADELVRVQFGISYTSGASVMNILVEDSEDDRWFNAVWTREPGDTLHEYFIEYSYSGSNCCWAETNIQYDITDIFPNTSYVYYADADPTRGFCDIIDDFSVNCNLGSSIPRDEAVRVFFDVPYTPDTAYYEFYSTLTSGFETRYTVVFANEDDLDVDPPPTPDELLLLRPNAVVTETLGNPPFVWTNTGASGYQLAVFDVSGGTFDLKFFNNNITVADCDADQCSLVLTDLSPAAWLDNGDYQAYLNEANGSVSDWTGPFDFSIQIDECPVVPTNIAVTGLDTPRPTISWTLTGAEQLATFFQLILVTSNAPIQLEFNQWVLRENVCGSEFGTICSFNVPTDLQAGTGYSLYMRSLGPCGFSTGGNVSGLDGFSLTDFRTDTTFGVIPPAGLPSNLEVDTSFNPPIFTWTAPSNATEYQVWIGTITPFNQALFGKYSSSQLNCPNEGDTCTLTPLFNPPLRTGVNHLWWVRASGPGGANTDNNQGWVNGPNFTPR